MNDSIVTRNLSWQELVQKSWGSEYSAPETAYQFTGRKFIDAAATFDTSSLTSTDSLYADSYADNYA